MKKIVYILTAALALGALSAACNKVTPVDDTPVAKTMTIKVTLSDAATRVTFDPAFGSDFKPTGLSHTWETGDQLRITDASNPSVSAVFDLVEGAGTATGTFKGTGFEAASYNVEAIPNGTFSTSTSQTQAKDGATDHLKFVAAATGVTDLSEFALTETSGVLAVIAKLPSGVAATIENVSVDVSLSGTTMTALSIALTAQEDVDSDEVLKIYANIPAGFSIPESGDAFLKFASTNAGHQVYTRYLPLSVLGDLKEGKFNYIKLNCSHIDQYAGGDDDGMEENPYKIADKYQLMAMKDLVEEDNTTSFQLLADVDLAGEEWVPFNYASPYKNYVDFEGNGHKILNLSCSFASYPSFAGVVAGDIENVTFVNPEIVTVSQHAGVVGGYIGTTGIIGNCTNVNVENASVSGSGSPSKGRNLGGFGGMLAAEGTIKDCHVKGATITQAMTPTGSNAAGFIGNVAAAATIEGCTVTADVSNAASYYTGGFIGTIGSAVPVKIKSCAYLGGKITAERNNNNSPVGGFIGRITSGANAVIEGCYVDGVTIDAPASGRVGGFVGESHNDNTITSCYVKNSTLSAGMNTAGFVGVIYSTTTSKCYVENTTVKANKAQAAGFAAYPENATITDCYTSADVNGESFDSIGGFIGIARGGITVKNCYENGTVSGTGNGVGAFVGTLSVAPASITQCVAWNASLPFAGVVTEGVDTATVTDNYTGTEGSIYEQAVTLGGWDFTGTWTTDATPKLK